MSEAELVKVEVEGLKEAQDRLTRLAQRLGSGAGVEAIMARAMLRAHRYATMIVHVDTGRLKNSLFPRLSRAPNTIYAVVGTNVVYAPFEHARGGTHAFFQRTIDEEGAAIMAQVEADVAREVQRT